MFSWDGNANDAFWAGRRYDSPLALSGPVFELLGGYEKGEVWCSTMFELYRKLGGDSSRAARRAAARDLAIRLHLVANGGVPKENASVTQMAMAIGEADASLGGWRYPDLLHQKVIDDTFSRRAVPGYAHSRWMSTWTTAAAAATGRPAVRTGSVRASGRRATATLPTCG